MDASSVVALVAVIATGVTALAGFAVQIVQSERSRTQTSRRERYVEVRGAYDELLAAFTAGALERMFALETGEVLTAARLAKREELSNVRLLRARLTFLGVPGGVEDAARAVTKALLTPVPVARVSTAEQVLEIEAPVRAAIDEFARAAGEHARTLL